MAPGASASSAHAAPAAPPSLRDALALYQGHGDLPRLPSGPRHRAERGRSLQKGVVFQRLQSALAEATRQCVGSRSPGESSKKRGKKV